MRRILWPTIAAAIAFAILIGLGTWQVQRLQWKEDLLATIDARIDAEPVDLAAAERAFAAGNGDYLRVTVSGTYAHADERHIYQIEQGRPGWHVLTPLVLADGRRLIVNRGYVPLDRKDPASRPETRVAGPVVITGLVRGPQRVGPFAPENAPDKNEWFWRDVPGLAASLPDGGTVLPFVIDAEAGGDPGDLPIDGTTIVDLPNNHLGYLLTWYGLAVTLVLVYIPFVRRRIRAD